MKYFSILITILLFGCGSSEIIPTTDKCTFKKHLKDPLYQVQINGEKISNRWYLLDDAYDIADRLHSQNKCMKLRR